MAMRARMCCNKYKQGTRATAVTNAAASGTYTPAATSNIWMVQAQMWGGGGGASYSVVQGNSGGGGGSFCRYVSYVIPGVGYAYTVGAGGTAGIVVEAAGGTGGSTTFNGGSAPGGTGSQVGVNGAGGTPTTGNYGDAALRNVAGNNGLAAPAGTNGEDGGNAGGPTGAGTGGAGGNGGNGNGNAGSAGSAPGGGAGGGSINNATPKAGAVGRITITY